VVQVRLFHEWATAKVIAMMNVRTKAISLLVVLTACGAPHAGQNGDQTMLPANTSEASSVAAAGPQATAGAIPPDAPRTAPTPPAREPQLDVEGLGKELGGWRKKEVYKESKKEYTAAEYKSGGSNYRTYKPTVSPTTDGGLFVSTKLDHIRGGGRDDHCQLEITFDRAGKVVSSRAEVTMDDNRVKFNTKLVAASAALAGATAGTSAAIAVATKIVESLYNQIAAWTDDGGRKNFPAVVQHNFNLICHGVTN
jgi:hypothetical protein